MENAQFLSGDLYRIEGRLGSGGGGIVYKAWHTHLQKYVVIKELKRGTKDSIIDCATEAIQYLKENTDETEILPDESISSDKTELISCDSNNTEILSEQAVTSTYDAADKGVSHDKQKHRSSPRKFKSADKKWGLLIVRIFAFLIIISALFAGVALYIIDNPEIKTGYYLVKAEDEYKSGNYEKAINDYEKVIQINPDNFQSYIGIAEIYHSTGKCEMAINTLYEGYRVTGSEKIWALIKEYSFDINN